MPEFRIRRKDIVTAITTALEASDDVTALWEGGAAAFDRVDEWSDVDMMIAVKSGTKDAAIALVDEALGNLAPFAVRYRLPEPAWHGHSQVFYMLEGASPYEFVDTCFMDDDTKRKFLEPETHGKAFVHFDRAGFIDQTPADPGETRERLGKRVAALKQTTALGRTGTLKELARGNELEALAYYNGSMLRPLVELLRMRHCPGRQQFHTRYIQYDLPEELVTRLRPFFFVRDAEDIRARHAEAGAWIDRLLVELGEEFGV